MVLGGGVADASHPFGMAAGFQHGAARRRGDDPEFLPDGAVLPGAVAWIGHRGEAPDGEVFRHDALRVLQLP